MLLLLFSGFPFFFLHHVLVHLFWVVHLGIRYVGIGTYFWFFWFSATMLHFSWKDLGEVPFWFWVCTICFSFDFSWISLRSHLIYIKVELNCAHVFFSTFFAKPNALEYVWNFGMWDKNENLIPFMIYYGKNMNSQLGLWFQLYFHSSQLWFLSKFSYNSKND